MQAVKKKNFTRRADKLVDFKKLQKLSQKLKIENRKIVFTTGSFDLLNPGHCRFLAEAKACGDILVVGVSTDESDSRLKGKAFPLITEEIRAELVSHLKSVDYVTIVDEDRPQAALILLQPDIFYTSADSWEKGLRDEQDVAVVKMYGGKIVKREKLEPYFTVSDLVGHIADIRVVQILNSYLKEKIENFALDSARHLQPVDFGDQTPGDRKAFDSRKLIVPFDSLAELGDKLREEKKRVVFVSGSYDLLHVGHSRFIERAALLGDVLVVGIPSDESLRTLKGIGRPVISAKSRAYVLGHLDSVDFVTVFDDLSVLPVLESLKPEVFFTVDEEWNNGYKDSPEYKMVHGYGGKIVRAKRQAPHISASVIIDTLAREKVKEIFKECMDDARYQKILSEKSRLNGKGRKR